LSEIVVDSIEAKQQDANINATRRMGAGLISSGRTIRQLMGAEYDSLSEQQKNEISRMESKANRETNPDIKANSLGRAVALAQQYMQQNQANQTGEGGSKSLPAVMTEISQGITTFNDTMTQLKNALSNQGSTMTITLNK
jgi:Sec-independent protein translocase protein TatA